MNQSLSVPSSIRGRCRTLFRQPRCRRLRLRCRRCPGPEEGSRAPAWARFQEQPNRLWDLQNIPVGDSIESRNDDRHRLAGLSRANRARRRSLPVTTILPSIAPKQRSMLSSVRRFLPRPLPTYSSTTFTQKSLKRSIALEPTRRNVFSIEAP